MVASTAGIGYVYDRKLELKGYAVSVSAGKRASNWEPNMRARREPAMKSDMMHPW